MFCALKIFNVTDVKHLPALYTSVRFATKPRWVPMAKTKRLRIIPPHVLPEEQQNERTRLSRIYRTQLKTTLEYFKKLYREKETSDEVMEKLRQEEEDEWQRCMMINDEWNKRVAAEREQRDAIEYENEVEKAKEIMKMMDEKQLQEQMKVDNLIKEQKELSKTFITEANIDEHIDKILNVDEPVTYNWAMDVNGNVYEGYNTTPNPNKKLVARFNTEKQEIQSLS